MDESRLPVVIGVGQFTNRAQNPSDALEPLNMMALVARRAEAAAGVPGLLAHVDSLRVVNVLAWRYQDPAWQLAQRLRLRPVEALYTTIRSKTPQRLANPTAHPIPPPPTSL